MGTITVGVSKDILEFNPMERFKKHCQKISCALSRKERGKQKLDERNNYLMKTGYQHYLHGYLDGKYVMVVSNPMPYFVNLPEYKITWHQSQWSSQKEVVDVFVRVFGLNDACAILCKGRIFRLDLWLDLEMPYRLLLKSIYRPRTKNTEQVRSDRRTIYFGASKDKVALIYEKDFDSRESLDLKYPNQINKHCTRIEIRYFNKNVPIDTFADYSELSNLNLFDMLKTYLFRDKDLRSIAGGNSRSLLNVDKFLRLRDTDGLSYAIKMMNVNRNFYRTIEPLLKKVSRDLELSDRWRGKIESRIVGGFNIRSYFIEQGVQL